MKNPELAPISIAKGKTNRQSREEIANGLREYHGLDPDHDDQTEVLEDSYADRYEEDDRYDGIEDEEDEEYEDTREPVPPGLLETEGITDKEGIHNIYHWYSAAMRRRNREPLDQSSFVSHYFRGGSFDRPCAFGNPEQGYLLGFSKYGVFIPSHFAPKSLRQGYELLKKLGASQEIPSTMMITDDIAETLKKMPEWTIVDMGFMAQFRGQEVKKTLAYNSHPNVRQLMYGLLYDYLEDKNGCEPNRSPRSAN